MKATRLLKHPWFWLVGFFPLLSFLGMAASHGTAKSKENGLTVFKDISYKPGSNHPAHRLDLYLPGTVGAETPVLFMVHGGAWISGTKTGYEPLARNFAKAGVVAVVPDYRLSPEVRHPAHWEDVVDALKWTVSQAEKYGFSPSKITFLGHSAGAFMGACLAVNPKDLPSGVPAGFIALAGIYDLPTLDKKWPGYDKWFLNQAFGPKGAPWKEFSPRYSRLGNRSSWLVLHGDGDELVDVDQSRAFAEHLKEEGVSVEFIVGKGLDHFGVLRDLGSSRNPFTENILKRLR